MNIDFVDPFKFHLKVVETDDHIPAMRVLLTIQIEQFQHSFCYEGGIWIECVVWEAFTQGLHVPSNAVSLYDMNGTFALTPKQNTDSSILLTWKFNKADINGQRCMAAEFISVLNDDSWAKIRHQFNDFPAWW